jgi:hypothetical protein
MFEMFRLFSTYVAKVLSGCCKGRSGYCTARPVAIAAAGAQPWVNPCGFPHVGHGVARGREVPVTDAGAGAGTGRGTWGMGWDADAGAAQVSERCPDAMSCPPSRH